MVYYIFLNMPQSKNAYIRYRVLDRCFRDRRKRYYIEDLVDACNNELNDYDGSSVSERTIRDDIRFMQRQAGGGVPLVIKEKDIRFIISIQIGIFL